MKIARRDPPIARFPPTFAPFRFTCSRYSFKRREILHTYSTGIIEQTICSRGQRNFEGREGQVAGNSLSLDLLWVWMDCSNLDHLSILRGFCFNLGRGIGLDGMRISEKLIKAIIEKDFVARDYINFHDRDIWQ